MNEPTLAGITTVEAANRFISNVHIPAHNARFAVKAEQDASAFVAIPGVDLKEVLCVQEDRELDNGNTPVPRPLRPCGVLKEDAH